MKVKHNLVLVIPLFESKLDLKEGLTENTANTGGNSEAP